MFRPLAGTKGDYLSRFQGEDSGERYDQAVRLWAQLDDRALWCLLAMLLFSLCGAYIYYGPFNGQPGRHWRPKFWWRFLVVAAGLTFVASLAILFTARPAVDGALAIELRAAVNNAVYAILTFWIASAVTRHYFPTNAYFPRYIP